MQRNTLILACLDLIPAIFSLCKVMGGKGNSGSSKKRPSAEEEVDETIPKGGIAYYVRIDEGLAPPVGSAPFNYDYNPKGIMNKPQLLFDDGTVATTTDPAEKEALKNQINKQKQRLLNINKEYSETIAQHAVTSDDVNSGATTSQSNHDLKQKNDFLNQILAQDTDA